jgi:hypothetical protein
MMDVVVTRRLVKFGLVLVFVLAYSWIAAAFRPFTQPENAAVALPALVVVAVSWRRSDFGKGGGAGPLRPPAAATAIWVLLLVVLTAWELAAYALSPRHSHPTLSSISDSLMSVHVGRAAAFLGWLVVGWVLFVRPKATR